MVGKHWNRRCGLWLTFVTPQNETGSAMCLAHWVSLVHALSMCTGSMIDTIMMVDAWGMVNTRSTSEAGTKEVRACQDSNLESSDP